jgi:hypothetical protein
MTPRDRNLLTRRLSVLGAMLLGCVLTVSLSDAQTRQPVPRARPTTKAPKAPKPAASAGAAATDTAHASTGENAGEVVAQKTVDGGTKVFRFGELEIEGRLKNPQLVFFLRRVRAEFAAGDLGHRSFLRELGDTRHDPNF